MDLNAMVLPESGDVGSAVEQDDVVVAGLEEVFEHGNNLRVKQINWCISRITASR